MSEEENYDQAGLPRYAFKEWYLVCEALASGEQNILLRKGGIAEGRGGFSWEEDKFLLYPTYFHQQVDSLLPHKDGSPRRLPASPVGSSEKPPTEVEFSLLVQVEASGFFSEWEEIVNPEIQHVWKEEVLRERFDWGKKKGISWAKVSVERLRNSLRVPFQKNFKGCRSWVELPDWEKSREVNRQNTVDPL